MGIYLSITAIILYLVSAFILAASLVDAEKTGTRSSRLQFITVGTFALIFHALVLYQNINIAGGLNLAFYNALSLTSWTASLIVLIAALWKPLENLAIIIFPVTALALGLEILFPASRLLSDSAPAGLRIHVILSVCAYGLLTIAALQAALLALQDRQISKKHPASIMRLPPMQLMEDLLIQIIAIGFFLLSLSLVTGLMFLNDIFGQHLVHKTVLSILAWLIFGILLWGRWAWGWRGKTAMKWTIWGFVFLMLAYFGSKLVLELLLKRI